MDRDEVGQARDRILQPPAVDGSGLEDWIADRSRVPVREDVVVRQDHRPSAATREDAQGPCGDPIVTDADAALGRPHAMGPPFAAATPSRGIDHPFRSKALISRRPSPSFPPVAVPATRTTRFATNPRKTPIP